MITKDNEPIVLMSDGDYTIQYGPYRYVVRDFDASGAFKKAEVESYLAAHPEALVPEPVPPPPTPEALASQARALRDARLVANDRQIIIASRAQRMDDPAATVRLAALDAYAVALCDWPESEGFPDLSTIPVTPIIN